MKISYKRLLLVVLAIFAWILFWVITPHNAPVRMSVEGVCSECEQYRLLVHKENLADYREKINALKGVR